MCSCRDGEQIESEEAEKYVFSDDSSELTIRKVDKGDEAEYVCIAENKAGEQDASIHLKVFGECREGSVAVVPQRLLPNTLRLAARPQGSTPPGVHPQVDHFFPAPPPSPSPSHPPHWPGRQPPSYLVSLPTLVPFGLSCPQ